MKTIDLSGKWDLFYFADAASPANPAELGKTTDDNHINAIVPGNVELDMMEAGILPDISHGNNIYLLREYENHHWWYRNTFDFTDKSNGQKIELCFDGVDTIADIWLNGKLIGRCENMFIPHGFDVTHELRPGKNELIVHIFPAIIEGKKYQPQPGEHAVNNCWESLRVRKSPYMYGWDIFPRIVTAGLWRNVYLQEAAPIGIEYAAYSTLSIDREKSSATIIMDCNFRNETSENLDGYELNVSLSHNGENRVKEQFNIFGQHLRQIMEIENANLWWPAGYGEAALYDAIIELKSPDGTVIDTHKTKLGLRTIELKRTDLLDENGNGEFAFIINGEKIFIRGTNWVPLDALPSRSHHHMDSVLEMLSDLNCNMVRCWGGGYYEDHDFYDYCDTNGIMVWQDFMLACACYPQDEQFRKTIENEAGVIMQKLRNHASIVLWAGNNEIDEAYGWAGYDLNPNEVDIISRETLKKVVSRFSPKTPYLPSSPFRSDAFYEKGKDLSLLSEVHLWEDRNDFKSDYYKNTPAKFISEIGYHGCPASSTLQRMFDAEYLWPWQDNDQWLTRAVRSVKELETCNYRIALMDKNIQTWFGESMDNLDDHVLASQFCQAEALKFFIELMRIDKFNKTGILWWNLRDGWPIISDAVVDYYNTPQLSYKHIKKSQTDFCVMIFEPSDGLHKVIAANDTLATLDGELKIYDADTKEVLYVGTFSIAANNKTELCTLPVATDNRLWCMEWLTSSQIAGYNHYITGQKPYDFNKIKSWIEDYLNR